MLLRRYLIGHFLKTHLSLTLLFTAFILAAQLFNTVHLLFALPIWSGLSYLLLVAAYTFLVGAAIAIFVAGADFIYTLKERRTFHILYTFGVSEKRVMRTVWLAVASVALAGALAAPFVNYQKISYLVKYMKFQFGEKILLTVPPKSFFTDEGISFFFTSKGGNVFENVVVKFGKDIATAKRATLYPDGTLRLERTSVFGTQGEYVTWMESESYTLSLGGTYSYTLSGKKILENALFVLTLFIFPLFAFPFFFQTIFKRAETKFSSYMWGILFLVLQFGLALAVKAAV